MLLVACERKRTYARILLVRVCFDKPVQVAPDLFYSLYASQGVKKTSSMQLSSALAAGNLPKSEKRMV